MLGLSADGGNSREVNWIDLYIQVKDVPENASKATPSSNSSNRGRNVVLL
jgi:hypothetical protein